MFYLEFRFNTKNKTLAKSIIDKYRNGMEIISFLEDDYYICFNLNKPLEKSLVQKFKQEKTFYFICYYAK